MRHLTLDELQAGLEEIRRSPTDRGMLAAIVRRPRSGVRDVLEEGVLDVVEGLVGDNWKIRGSSRTPDRSSHPDMQLSIMNARVMALVAGEKDRWQLSGDQLFIDLDMSTANLPAGTRLAMGTAVIEVTSQSHTSCRTFAACYGHDAANFLHSPVGVPLRLRGINARIIRSGVIRVGDAVRKARDVAS